MIAYVNGDYLHTFVMIAFEEIAIQNYGIRFTIRYLLYPFYSILPARPKPLLDWVLVEDGSLKSSE